MTDEQIMIEVKSGDLTKASILFDRYHKHLYNFFVKISFDRDLGNDLTQNVFLRMIKFRHTYRADSNFKSWIFKIARNVNADHYRNNKIAASKNESVDDLCQDIVDQQETTRQIEQDRILYRAMEKLSIEDRALLQLSKFQKMKYEHIAEIHGTSVGAIKVKVHRAIQKLKDHYFKLEKI